MQVSEDDLAVFAQVGRHNTKFVDILVQRRQAELENLARTSVDQFSTLKGRVQMLTELLQQLRP